MKKSEKNSSSFPSNQELLLPSVTETKLTQLVSDYGRKALYTILILFLISVIMYRMSSSSKVEALNDYMSARKGLSHLQESPADPKAPSLDKAFIKLNDILERHPELQEKYDPLIAQTLIEKGDSKLAKPFVDRALTRISQDNLSFFADFSKTTLLICDEHYQEAFMQAAALKEKMEKYFQTEQTQPDSFGNMLFSFNLLRIAFLQQQIGSLEAERASWEAFMKFAAEKSGDKSLHPIHSQEFELLLHHLEQGSVSLLKYIENRVKYLNG